MQKLILLTALMFFGVNAYGQNPNVQPDLNKIVETEKAFAQAAETKGIRSAFLEFLADDGVIFRPNAINGKESWLARSESQALLSWQPSFADVSSNGVLGYSTGAGEFRPKGKTGTEVYYSEYATVWRKQPDGNYKAVIDMGISHDKPLTSETVWKSPVYTVKVTGADKPYAANTANLFFDTATTKGLSAAYKMFATDDVRFLREGKLPILGKQNALAETKKDKSKIVFGKSMTIQSAGDMAYALTTFEKKDGIKIFERGNTLQIWKLRDGKWQIVLDVMNLIPADKK
jgi:ketosteroid isomerase-like protein